MSTIVPAKAITGSWYFLAPRATSAGILPRGVWKSMLPSAVITRSDSLSKLSISYLPA
jgi:hypothetical protein